MDVSERFLVRIIALARHRRITDSAEVAVKHIVDNS